MMKSLVKPELLAADLRMYLQVECLMFGRWLFSRKHPGSFPPPPMSNFALLGSGSVEIL